MLFSFEDLLCSSMGQIDELDSTLTLLFKSFMIEILKIK